MCQGHGCDGCDDGYVRIQGCPTRFCSSIAEVVDLIDMANKGHMPVSGGVLDQSAGFVEAVQQFNNEMARVRNEQLSRHSD